MNFPSLSCLTSLADVHLLPEESVRGVWRGQMCVWMGSHSENMPVVFSFIFKFFMAASLGVRTIALLPGVKAFIVKNGGFWLTVRPFNIPALSYSNQTAD